MSGLAIAFLPLIGVIIGAAVQFFLNRSAEKERQFDTLKTVAYVDYLRAIAASGHLRTDEDLRDAFRDAANAKTRIAVFGSAKVVHALAQFEEVGSVLDNPRARNAFIQLVVAMRPVNDTLAQRDIELILFGIKNEDANIKANLPV